MTQTVNVHIGLAAWSGVTYAVGNRCSNAGNAYQCITAGLSTAAPTGTGASINNGGVAVWKFLSTIDFITGDLRYNISSPVPATLTQPVIFLIWNDALITPAVGVQALWLAGHTTTSTNNITVMPAPGDGFAAAYLATPSLPLAFNPANGVAIQCPVSGVGGVNYIQIDDNNVILSGIQIQDPNPTSGSTLVGGAGATITVQKCIFDGYAQTGGAVILQLENGLKLTNNLFIARNTTAGGAVVQVGATTGVVAANNTFVQLATLTGQAALDSGANPTASSNKAVNNIFINYPIVFIASASLSWTTNHNFYTAASFSGSNAGIDTGGSVYGITAATTFAAFDPFSTAFSGSFGGLDFNLVAGAAPLNAGATDTADIPTADDIFGRSRPQGTFWDGGAMELATSVFTAPLSDTAVTSDHVGSNYVASRTDTAATSDSFIPASGIFGSVASCTDTATTSDALTVASGFSATFGTSVNIISNSAGAGGVVGTPGTLPTGWVVYQNPGLSVQVIATTGGSFTDIRFFGTCSGGNLNLSFDDPFATALPSTSYTWSVGAAMTAGSTANIAAINQGLDSLDGSGNYISTGADINDTLTGTVQTFSSSMVSAATTGQVNAHFSLLGIVNGGAVDITIRFLNPQVTTGGNGDTTLTSDSFTIPGVARVLPTDTASSSDSYAALAGAFSGSLADSAVTSSAQSTGPVNLLADSVASGDTLYRPPFSGFSAGFSSGFGTSLVVTPQGGMAAIAAPVDTAVTSDTFTGAVGVVAPALTDTAVTSDTLTFNAAPVMADTAVTSDSRTGVLTIAPVNLTDTAASSDSLSFASSVPTSLSDGAVTSDALTSIAFGLGTADTGVTSDSLTSVATIIATLSNTAASSDGLLVLAAGLALGDSAASSDGFTLNSGYATALGDSAVSSDTVTPAAVAPTGSLTATAATSETLSAALALSLALSDSIVSSDSASAGGYGLPLADSIASSDSTSAAGVGPAASSDSAVSSDALTLLLQGYAASLSDTAATSETLQLSPIAVTAIIGDTAVSSDTVSVATVARSGASADSIASADEYNIVTYLTAVSDSAATSDSQTAIGRSAFVSADSAASSDVYASLTLLDSATTGDALTAQAMGLQGFLDVLLSGDITLSVLGFIGSWADTAATSDALVQPGFGYGFVLADTLISSEIWTNTGVGAPLTMIVTAVPTGGAVMLEFPGYFPVPSQATSLTISRSIAGSGIWTVIYQGPPVGVFIDVGDGTPRPLDPTISYIWQAVDYSGTTVSAPVTPAASFIGVPDQLSQILIRLLQGAINSMRLPPGIQPTQITTRMPQNGWQAMPFIVVNLDLIQQTEVQIGEDVLNPTPDNNWTLFANAKRIWRVTIMSQDVEERDFYRDTLLAVFRVLKATAFGPLGINVTHAFQAASYASAAEYEGVAPGFYAADLMLELDGIFPAAVLTHYPVITEIVPDGNYATDLFTITLTPSAGG